MRLGVDAGEILEHHQWGVHSLHVLLQPEWCTLTNWPGYEWNTPKRSHSEPLVDLKKEQLRTRLHLLPQVHHATCPSAMQCAIIILIFISAQLVTYKACSSLQHSHA